MFRAALQAAAFVECDPLTLMQIGLNMRFPWPVTWAAPFARRSPPALAFFWTLHGGKRKVGTRLRLKGIRTSKARVRRILRENRVPASKA